MIEYPHIDERQGVLQAPGQEFVGAARFGKTGRVIVGEDHSSGIVLEGAADNFSWVYAGAIDGAVEHLLKTDDPMPVVEK
ncbi:MAG TPA: hypothetical protein VHH35_00965 [Pyrinomonadaceae bacterium]|nr:hypothetical protein [Pyrinomonadaceae bacterium]